MGRKNKIDVRRKEILETCYDQIEREGIDGVTLKKIGKQMDVAPSLIMHYFQNKDELIRALVDYMLERMDFVYIPHLSKFPTARERLIFFIDETINLSIAQSVSDAVWYACFALGMHNPEIREGFRRAYDRDLAVSEKLFREFLEEEGIEGVDPAILSVKLISFVEGLNILQATYGRKAIFTEAIRELREDFLRVLDNVSLKAKTGAGKGGTEEER
jgi:AcrR family transcriptional regulator